MKKVRRPFLSVHRLGLAACLLLVLAGAWQFRSAPAASAALTQADIVALHRGKVDDAALSRLAAPGAGALAAPDVSAIRKYLQTPAAAPVEIAQLSPATPPRPATPERHFVGQQMCESCHSKEADNWAHTVHAAVFTLNPRNDLASQGCEACHGPGSAHVDHPSAAGGIISFRHGGATPVAQQNAQCLSCHQGGPRIFWHGSIHENEKLGCSDCHNPMARFSVKGLTARDSINQTCFGCHAVQHAEFNKRSHMPLLEGKLSCTDCHNPHGSSTAPLLKADSVNELCATCHAEKRGPFLFEHAPVRENCLNCHNPHGSNFEALLTAPRPLLCQQCHAQDGHPATLLTRGNLPGGPRPDPRLMANSCQACHVNVHGSNSPAGARFER